MNDLSMVINDLKSVTNNGKYRYIGKTNNGKSVSVNPEYIKNISLVESPENPTNTAIRLML